MSLLRAGRSLRWLVCAIMTGFALYGTAFYGVPSVPHQDMHDERTRGDSI